MFRNPSVIFITKCNIDKIYQNVFTQTCTDIKCESIGQGMHKSSVTESHLKTPTSHSLIS